MSAQSSTSCINLEGSGVLNAITRYFQTLNENSVRYYNLRQLAYEICSKAAENLGIESHTVHLVMTCSDKGDAVSFIEHHFIGRGCRSYTPTCYGNVPAHVVVHAVFNAAAEALDDQRRAALIGKPCDLRQVGITDAIGDVFPAPV